MLDSNGSSNSAADISNDPPLDGAAHDRDQVLDLEDALSMNKVSLFQYRLLFICGLAMMADAMEINLLGFLSICAADEWGLSDSAEAVIAGTVFAGIVLGSLFWGEFADRFGRRMTYLLSNSLIAGAGFLSGASPSIYWLVFFRALVGIGIGGSFVPFDQLAEFLPASHRGKFLIWIFYFWVLGSLLVAALAWGTLNSQGWRFLAFMTAVPIAITTALSSIYLPESPRWLLMKGKVAEACEVVRRAAEVNGVEMPAFTLNCDDAVNMNQHAQYWDLVKTPQVRNITIPLCTVWAMFGFAYYGVIIFINKLFEKSSESSGDDDGDVCDFDYPAIFYNALSEIAGVYFGALLIDRWGRVYSQAAFYGVGALTAFIIGFNLPYGGLLFVSIIARLCAMAAANATWVSTSEVYSTDLRTEGHAAGSASSKITAFLSPFLVFSPASNIAIGAVLAVMNVIAAGATLCLPETAGKDLDKVESFRALSAQHEQEQAPTTHASEPETSSSSASASSSSTSGSLTVSQLGSATAKAVKKSISIGDGLNKSVKRTKLCTKSDEDFDVNAAPASERTTAAATAAAITTVEMTTTVNQLHNYTAAPRDEDLHQQPAPGDKIDIAITDKI